MKILNYEIFWSMVDAVDEYIGDSFTKHKYVGLLGYSIHYPRLYNEYKYSPTMAIQAIILMKYQEDGDVLVCMRPKEWTRINKGASLETILAMVKSKWMNKRRHNERD